MATTLYTSGVLPAKIVMKGTSQITLNDRFSDLTTGNGLATIGRREPSVVRRLDDDDVIGGRSGRGPSANQLLARRMDSRPAVRAALKLRNKSVRQRLGVMARLDVDSRNDFGMGLTLMKNNNIFDRISSGSGRPQRRGGGSFTFNGFNNATSNRNGFYSYGGRRRYYRPYVRNGAFPPRYPRRSYRPSYDNGFVGGFGNYRFRPRNRYWRNRRFNGYTGYYRNGSSSTYQNKPRLNKDALDQDLDEYMAKTKLQLDADMDTYMADVEAV